MRNRLRLQYGVAATIHFTLYEHATIAQEHITDHFADGGDWTPGGTSAILVKDGVVIGFPTGTVEYVGSYVWQFPLTAAELQTECLHVIIADAPNIADYTLDVRTYGNASARHPNIGLTTFGSVGTVEHVIAGTIDLVDLVAAGTVDLAAVAAIVETGTIDLVAQLASGTIGLVESGTIDLVAEVAAGTIGLVNSGTIDMVAVAAAVESGTVDLVAQLAAGTVDLAKSGTADLVSSGTVDLVAQLAAGTVGLVSSGTIGLVSSGTIDLVAQLAAGTVGLVSSGSIDVVSSGTIGLVAQLTAGTIDLVKTGTIDKVTLVSSGTIDLANAFAAAAITSVWNAGTKQQYQMKVYPAYDVNSDKFSVCAWLERDDVALDLTTATFKLYTYNGTLVYTGSSWNTGPTEITALHSWFVEKTVATNIRGGTAYIVKTEMVYDGTTFTRLSGFGAAGTGT